MGSKKLIAVGMAVLVALNMGTGAAVAATNTGGTVQAQTEDVTSVDLNLDVTDTNGNSGPYTPGTEIRFKVTDDGDNAVENATVEVGDEMLETDSGGYAYTTLNSEGEYAATASKEAQNGTEYTQASATFSIERETTNLSLKVKDMNGNEGPYVPGTEIRFTVKDDSGNAVENATVEVGGETLETDASGYAYTTLYDEGEHEAVASKEQTQTTEFNETSANFTIQKETTNLSLKVRDMNGNKDPYVPGTEVKFTVKDEGGNGVDGATVEVGSHTLTTDPSGVVTETFDDEGEYEAVASKSDSTDTEFNEASANFTVERETTNLSLKVTDMNGNSDPYTPGTEVKFKVKDEGGNGVENATVDVEDYSLETNSNGVATATFDDEGEYEAVASKNQTETTEFNEASENFTVERETSELSLTVTDTNGNSGPFMPGTEVEFTVKNESGSLENATVEVANQTLETNSNGVVTTTFNETGVLEATASKNQTKTVEYNSTTENVSIEYDTEELQLTVRDTSGNTGGSFIPNETIEFLVKNSNGNYVPNATVVVANETYVTDESGIATANITTVGTLEANATKNVTDGVQYVNDTATFNVSRVEEDLVLDIYDASGDENTTFVPGDVIVFDLDDTDSHSVANATLTVANKTLVTNESGMANTTINETGEFVVNATSDPNETTKYKPETKNITLDRYNESLTLDMLNESGANTTEFEPGETIEFVTAPNATVTVDNESYETGVNGTVNETFYKNGEYNVTVTKATNLTTEFQNVSGTFTVNGTELWVDSAINGSDTLSVNETRSGNITLNVAPNGLAGYNVVLTVDDNATFTDATNSSAFELANVTVRDNGSVVEYDAVDLEKNVQAGDEDIDLGTFEIEGESDGLANLSIEIEDIESGNETAVDAGTDGSTVEVIQPPTVTNETAASDPDSDGTYEDLNGNGEVDYSDTVALFENKEDDSVQENAALFDFTGDGTVGYSDIISLYEMTGDGS